MKIPNLFGKGEAESEVQEPKEDNLILVPQPVDTGDISQAPVVDNTESIKETIDIESLWVEITEQPNDDKKLHQLMRYCFQKKGDKAVDAALEALSQEPGSYLPRLILAGRALKRNSIVIATSYYQDIVDNGHVSDDILLRISADLGRYGYPDKMIRLVLPHYDADKHSEYTGLNLLQACKETKNYSAGRTLVEMLKARDSFSHARALDEFAELFNAEQNGDELSEEESNESSEKTSKAQSVAPNANDNPRSGALQINSVPEEPTDIAERPVMLYLPVWRAFIPVLDDLLPDPEKVSRVGIFIYSDATDYSQMEQFPAVELMKSLSLGLPLMIGEQLLFSSPVQPRVLVPVHYSAGPFPGASEPDVQKLFSLCAKESLDFLITGTMTQAKDQSTVRSWLLDRSKKTARILSKTASLEQWPQAIIEHAKELNSIFADKTYAFELKRKGLVYSAPHKDTVLMQTSGLYHLALRVLYAGEKCDESILCDSAVLLRMLADLCRAKPLSQNYLLMFLSAMIADQKMGGEAYLEYRTLLYETAQKMQYTPCVTKCKKAFDSVLRQ